MAPTVALPASKLDTSASPVPVQLDTTAPLVQLGFMEPNPEPSAAPVPRSTSAHTWPVHLREFVHHTSVLMGGGWVVMSGIAVTMPCSDPGLQLCESCQ